MNKDLTSSDIHRQNILNNPYAVQEIEKAFQVRGIPFEGKTVLLREQVEDFLRSWFEEGQYRRQFTDALRDCVDLGNAKYPLYTDLIYVSIFREKAREYRSFSVLASSIASKTAINASLSPSVLKCSCRMDTSIVSDAF